MVLLGRRLVLPDRRQGFPQLQQRGLDDGLRLLELRDFFSRVDAVLFEVVDLLFESGQSFFDGARRGFGFPLALQTTPGRLSHPIGRALSRLANGADHVGIHANRQLFYQVRSFRFHVTF